MVGRLSKQKDPHFFRRVAMLARAQERGLEFVWVGDGDARLKEDLERASIKVTGWVDPDRVARILADSSIYLHTAQYEGFPLSVLDAAKVGIPIVVKSLPAFEDSGLREVRDESDAATVIVEMLRSKQMLQTASRASSALTGRAQRAAQAASLSALYRTTLSGADVIR
jgi:glycosyltransferase involved in cell wall biosynthesis